MCLKGEKLAEIIQKQLERIRFLRVSDVNVLEKLYEELSPKYGKEVGILLPRILWEKARQTLLEERFRHEKEKRSLERVLNLYLFLYQILLLARHAVSRREFLQGLARLLLDVPETRLVWVKFEELNLVLPESMSDLRENLPLELIETPEWLPEPQILNVEDLPEVLRKISEKHHIQSWLFVPFFVKHWTSGGILAGFSRRDFSDWERTLLLEDFPGNIEACLESILERKIEEPHLFDPLTDLPLEHYFLVLMERTLGEAREKGKRFIMVALGVDRLVHVNQAFGFRTGDRLLRVLAERLKQFVGEKGMVCRGRSETFYVLIPEPENIHDYLDAMKRALGGPIKTGTLTLEVTVSMGIAHFPSDASMPGDLLKKARTALHEAKRLGGNRTAFFSADLHQKARNFLTLLPKLRKALDLNQFVIYCQPRIDLHEKRICGGEILVRWEDPEKGLVPPGEFIWVLEDSGLITELGLWVAEETCRILVELPREMFVSLNLSFNVSPRQLWGSNFVSRFLGILRKYKLCPTRIKIEITENIFIERTQEIIQELEKISRVGVKVVLDDFGTGYSSLHYLARLPVHDLKIDKTFVHGLPDSAEHMEIVKAIIALARALGKRVVAEGVETREQLKCLQRLGVDEVQGFLFSPPVPWKEFRKWLADFPEKWKRDLEAPTSCLHNVEEKCNLF